MTDIINRTAPITAVVCGNDYLAAGALSALDRAGIRVPQDLSIASFNDNDFAAYLHPPLTTVRLPIKEIGEMAGSYLITRLHKTAAPVPDPLAVQQIGRASCRARVCQYV